MTNYHRFQPPVPHKLLQQRTSFKTTGPISWSAQTEALAANPVQPNLGEKVTAKESWVT
jgi:hypothetical protein